MKDTNYTKGICFAINLIEDELKHAANAIASQKQLTQKARDESILFAAHGVWVRLQELRLLLLQEIGMEEKQDLLKLSTEQIKSLRDKGYAEVMLPNGNIMVINKDDLVFRKDEIDDFIARKNSGNA